VAADVVVQAAPIALAMGGLNKLLDGGGAVDQAAIDSGTSPYFRGIIGLPALLLLVSFLAERRPAP
jgi:hypothetical protein